MNRFIYLFIFVIIMMSVVENINLRFTEYYPSRIHSSNCLNLLSYKNVSNEKFWFDLFVFLYEWFESCFFNGQLWRHAMFPNSSMYNKSTC
ncbi:unnamed protein product [Heterobilharzia americana]|nr:unnamed protein product [Heterobilharzia americana]